MVHSGFLRQSINSNPSTVSYLLPLHQSIGGLSTSDFQSLEFLSRLNYENISLKLPLL